MKLLYGVICALWYDKLERFMSCFLCYEMFFQKVFNFVCKVERF